MTLVIAMSTRNSIIMAADSMACRKDSDGEWQPCAGNFRKITERDGFAVAMSGPMWIDAIYANEWVLDVLCGHNDLATAPYALAQALSAIGDAEGPADAGVSVLVGFFVDGVSHLVQLTSSGHEVELKVLHDRSGILTIGSGSSFADSFTKNWEVASIGDDEARELLEGVVTAMIVSERPRAPYRQHVGGTATSVQLRREGLVAGNTPAVHTSTMGRSIDGSRWVAVDVEYRQEQMELEAFECWAGDVGQREGMLRLMKRRKEISFSEFLEYLKLDHLESMLENSDCSRFKSAPNGPIAYYQTPRELENQWQHSPCRSEVKVPRGLAAYQFGMLMDLWAYRRADLKLLGHESGAVVEGVALPLYLDAFPAPDDESEESGWETLATESAESELELAWQW